MQSRHWRSIVWTAVAMPIVEHNINTKSVCQIDNKRFNGKYEKRAKEKIKKLTKSNELEHKSLVTRTAQPNTDSSSRTKFDSQ